MSGEIFLDIALLYLMAKNLSTITLRAVIKWLTLAVLLRRDRRRGSETECDVFAYVDICVQMALCHDNHLA